MSESTLPAPAPSRRWLNLAMIGCALMVLVLLVSALVLIDKETFGGLVTPLFLPIVSVSAMLGAVLMLVAVWNLPQRTQWQGILLAVWALIALTSPAFGYLFLIPWGVLIVLLPFVVAAFVTLRR